MDSTFDFKNIPHVQIPNGLNKNKDGVDINMETLLVYAYLYDSRDYKNNSTFISVDKLSERSGLNKSIVMSSLKSLVAKHYLFITKHNNRRSNIYTFTDKSLLDNFEPFSKEFLYELKLAPRLKAYWIALQHHTFKDSNTGYAYTDYSNEFLADMLKISTDTIKRYNRELKASGILNIEKHMATNKLTGEKTNRKVFDLNELKQDMFFVNKRLDKHDHEIELMKLQIKTLQEAILEQNEKEDARYRMIAEA